MEIAILIASIMLIAITILILMVWFISSSDKIREDATAKYAARVEVKYGVLVNRILNMYSSSCVQEDTPSSVTIVNSSQCTAVTFTVAQRHDDIVIHYDGKNRITGKESHMRWKFRSGVGQDIMFRKIVDSLA